MALHQKSSTSTGSVSGRSTPSSISEEAKQPPNSPLLPSINERLGISDDCVGRT